MLDLPWFSVEEGIQRLRETGMLEWICHLRPIYLYWEGPADIGFVNTLKKELVRGLFHDFSSL